MKRILSLIMCIVLVLGAFPPSAAFAMDRTEIDTEFELATMLLEYIGVIDKLSASELDKGVQRVDFAEYLAAMLRFKADGKTESSLFSDTKSEAVGYLASMGVFKGDGNGLFRPNDLITGKEAIIAATRLIGADFGNESNILNMARRLKLDMGLTQYSYLTMYDCIVLIYNTIIVEFGASGWSSDGTVDYSIDSEHQSILSSYYNIYAGSGQITANSLTTLRANEETELRNNHIKINETIYRGTEEIGMKYIGQNVKFFYYVAKNSSEREIVCILPDDRVNDTMVIDAESVISFKHNVLTYENERGKKTLSLDKNLALIYNGKATRRTHEDVFNLIEYGTVTLYKNKNGVYSVAIVEEMKNVVAKMIDQNKYLLYTDGDSTCDVIRFDKTPTEHRRQKVFLNNTDETVGLLTILPGNKLSVFCSEDGSVVKIHYNKNSLYGSVKQIKKDEGRTIITIDDEVYPCRAGVKIEIGKAYELTLDFAGVVAWASVAESKSQIGFLYDMELVKDAFENKVFAKIYSAESQFIIAELNKWVSVNGVRYTPEQTYAAFRVNGRAQRQLLSFFVGSNGKLTRLDRAGDGEVLTELTDGYKSLWHAGNGMQTFWPLYTYTGDTTVFVVPMEDCETPTRDMFAVTDMTIPKTPFIGSTEYSVRMYKDEQETPYVNYIVYPLSATPTISGYTPSMVVSEIQQCLVGDDVYTEITGYSEYIYKKLLIDSKIDTSMIEPGDVLNYEYNAVGEVGSIRHLYDASESKPCWTGSYGAYTKFRFGEISAVDYDPVLQKEIMLTIMYDGSVVERISTERNDFKFVVYDSSLREKNVYVGGIDDLLNAYMSGKKMHLLIAGVSGSYHEMYLFK